MAQSPSESKALLDPENDKKYAINPNQNSFQASLEFNNPSQSSKRGIWKRQILPRIFYYIPIVNWVSEYEIRSNFAGDLIAGLSVAVMIIPQSLAYASLAGLPPIYGLYTSFTPLLAYLIFGTSRHLAIGPEAVLSILVGVATTEILENVYGEESYTPDELVKLTISLASAMAFLVGVLNFALGLLRVGFVDNIFSRPLLRGFVTALAFLIIIEQIDIMCGVVSPELTKLHSWSKVWFVLSNTDLVHGISTAIGFSSLFILLLSKFLKAKIAKMNSRKLQLLRLIPEILLVVVLGIIVSAAFSLSSEGVPVLGKFESTFVTPKFPELSMVLITKLAFHVLIITLVGFIEAIVVVRNFATKYKYQISANRELVAYGFQNMIGSCFGTWPCFGALSRTAMNDQAGVKTQLSGGITAAVVLIAIMFLLPWFEPLPKPIMGSIVVYAGYCLFEWHEVEFLIHIQGWKDLSILFGTALLTIVFGAEVGILVCLCGSLFLIIKHSTFPTITIRGRIANTNKFEDLYVCNDLNLFDENHSWFHQANQFSEKGILVVRIEESLNFFNAGGLKALFWKIEQKSNFPLHGIVIDFRNVREVDATAAQTLLELFQEYKQREIKVCIVRLQDSTKQMFFKSGIVDVISPAYFFAKTSQAVTGIEKKSTTHSTYM